MWEAVFAFHICIAYCEFFRCEIAQRAVWAHLVVIDPPAFDGFPRIVQSEKPVLVEAFFAELAVEAFDVAVLHRPSGCDEVQCNFVLVGPLIQRPGGEFGAMVDYDAYRQSTLEPKLLQHSDHSQRR